MTALFAQLLAIAVAPLASRLLAGRRQATSFVEAAVQVVVVGTLVLHVLPEGLRAAGVAALAALILGFAAGLSSHRFPGGPRSARGAATVALLVHGLVDGAALGAGGPDTVLAWAVVLHTLPVSLAVWRLALREGGTRFAVTLLGVSAGATLLGFGASTALAAGASVALLGFVQCALAGALLHVVGHLATRPVAPWSGAGGAVGLALLLLGSVVDPVPGAGRALVGLTAAAAPWLLVAWAAMGVLHVAGNPSAAPRVTGRTAAGSALRGALLGLRLPQTSCGTLPVYRALVGGGASPAGALAFLVAGAGVSVATLAVSVPLLGAAHTLERGVAAALLGVATGLLVGRRIRPGPPRPPLLPPRRGARARVVEALRFAFVETVDHMAPWLVTGLVVGALADATLPDGALAPLPRPLVVVVAAAAGSPSWVCATGATPLVAVLLGKGMGPGAGLAFLLTGPAANTSSFALLRRLHGTRPTAGFAAVVVGGAVLAGLAADALALPAPPLPAPGPIGLGAAAALTVLVAVSFLRRGPSGFAEPLLHPHHDHEPPADHPFVRAPGAAPTAPVVSLGDLRPRA